MIKCVTIDDEPLALKQLNKYVSQVPFLELVGSFTNAIEASAFVSSEAVDLIFVDINMPDLNGLDFVRSLIGRKMVVFTTAYSEYAIESYKLDAVDYLLKPISFSDFLRAANKVHRQFELQQSAAAQPSTTEPESDEEVTITGENKEYISVKADHKVMLVKISDIDYVESESEYLRLHMNTGEVVMTLLRLKNIEPILTAGDFMRIHRSYIVNLKHIKAFAKGRVFLNDDVSLPVGDNYRDAFNNYIEKVYLNL
ncbi:MAG: response regulator transcription factor [Rikenellaceae bacterium]|nr:response regulator transcription factor [Rikenellaceae bacterium]